MSMHRIPLTDLERRGLEAHGLEIGTPSQLSDVFRQGMAYALRHGKALDLIDTPDRAFCAERDIPQLLKTLEHLYQETRSLDTKIQIGTAQSFALHLSNTLLERKPNTVTETVRIGETTDRAGRTYPVEVTVTRPAA